MRRSTVLRAGTALVLGLSLVACAGEAEVPQPRVSAALVGVALPTSELDRWAQGGEALRAELEDRGYAVDLQYAASDAATQVSQIQNMLTKDARALVVAAIAADPLRAVLRSASEADVPVVAYDRPLDGMDPLRDVAPDEGEIGRLQARSVLNGLGLTGLTGVPLANAPEGPLGIELFAGPPDDETALLRWEGAMEVLQPFLDDGTLVVPSGQTTFERAATPEVRWAESRLAAILTAQDAGGTQLDAVLSPSDEVSHGLVAVLRDAGYVPGLGWPVISGYGAEREAVRALAAGEQYATVFADPRELAQSAAAEIDALLSDGEPAPAEGVSPVIVRADLVERILLDTGYWSPDDLEG